LIDSSGLGGYGAFVRAVARRVDVCGRPGDSRSLRDDNQKSKGNRKFPAEMTNGKAKATADSLRE
jgi:hypothetical protein